MNYVIQILARQSLSLRKPLWDLNSSGIIRFSEEGNRHSARSETLSQDHTLAQLP